MVRIGEIKSGHKLALQRTSMANLRTVLAVMRKPYRLSWQPTTGI